MLEAIMAKIADMLQSWGVGRLINWINVDDRWIRVLRRLDLISANPKQSFDSIYAYTLAEYGSVKSSIIQRFFRHQFIKNAYKKGFELSTSPN